MELLSTHPYSEGAAVIWGLLMGLLLGVLAYNIAFGLCLGVGLGAVIDGIMRIRHSSVKPQ